MFTKLHFFCGQFATKKILTENHGKTSPDNVSKGVPVIAFTLVDGELRVCGNRNFVEKFTDDLLAMSKMEKLLKGIGIGIGIPDDTVN